MKIELENNKVFLENQGLKKEIHPFWLRERVNGDTFVDQNTQQRLFDPKELQKNVKIESLNISHDSLEITFSDGVHTKLKIKNILKEFSNINDVKDIKKIKWDSSLKDLNNFEFNEKELSMFVKILKEFALPVQYYSILKDGVLISAIQRNQNNFELTNLEFEKFLKKWEDEFTLLGKTILKRSTEIN